MSRQGAGSRKLAYLSGLQEGARQESARLREKVEAKRETVSGHLHAAFQSGKTASTLYWKETGREEAFDEVLALLAEPEPKPRAHAPCSWRRDADGYWITSCGDFFIYGAPDLKFCPYCGKPIAAEAGSA